VQIVVIDGQGGSVGKALVEALKRQISTVTVLAIGTNTLATAAMLQGGADRAATGENPVIVASRSAQVIIGPIGIIIADSLHGEITAAMATAITQSSAQKILIPITRCNVSVVGRESLPLSELIALAVEEVKPFVDTTG
jgi:NAD(P)-dependent dehydrogenase (short-subunit alcohol dehydrogenase family)